jgi:hypothetical protein
VAIRASIHQEIGVYTGVMALEVGNPVEGERDSAVKANTIPL